MVQIMLYRFRRHLSVAVLLGLVGLLPVNAWAQNASDTNVELLLLGTKGGPALLTPKRISQSSALVVDGEIVMIDAGYGASLRLAEAGHVDHTQRRRQLGRHHHLDLLDDLRRMGHVRGEGV